MKKRSLAGAISSDEECMAADSSRDIEVDLDVVCRGEVNLGLSNDRELAVTESSSRQTR